MLLTFLTLILTFSFVYPFPCPTSISPENPCKCRHYYRLLNVRCSGIYSQEDLVNSLAEYKGEALGYLILNDVNLHYIPHDAFQGFTVKNLYITNSSIMSLSDTEFAFEGQENSLYNIEFQDCEFTSEWDWSKLQNLVILKKLEFERGDLASIDDSMNMKLERLETFYFTANIISHIGDNAFSGFTKLETINLYGNLIKELKRSMFPNPASRLQRFYFNNNEISSLPDDLFTNMPALKYVEFKHNKFTTLKEGPFKPIFNQYTSFHFYDNELSCDCRLKWMLQEKTSLYIGGRCHRPNHLKKKLISTSDINNQVTASELYC